MWVACGASSRSGGPIAVGKNVLRAALVCRRPSRAQACREAGISYSERTERWSVVVVFLLASFGGVGCLGPVRPMGNL